MTDIKLERYQNTKTGIVFEVEKVTLMRVHISYPETGNKREVKRTAFEQCLSKGIYALELEAPKNWAYVVMQKPLFSQSVPSVARGFKTYSKAEVFMNAIRRNTDLSIFYILSIKLF